MAKTSSSNSFFQWRAIGQFLCLFTWLITLATRVFLGSLLPPIIMYPMLACIAVVVVIKFLTHASGLNDRGMLVTAAVALLSFIMLLSGSLPLLIIAAFAAVFGLSQYLVSYAVNLRQYNKYIGLITLSAMGLAIAFAVFSYLTSGAVVPMVLAMLILNITAVMFYFYYHPTSFENFKSVPSFTVVSLDFYAITILLHSIYIPLSLLLPGMFAMTISSGAFYLLHGTLLMSMTPFTIMMTENNDDHSLERDDINDNPVPNADYTESSMLMPKRLEEINTMPSLLASLGDFFVKLSNADAKQPSAPPLPQTGKNQI